MTDKCVVVAISGASGALYGVRLIRALAKSDVNVLVILSDGGLNVLAHEMGYDPGQSFVEFLASCHIKFKDPSGIEVFFSERNSGSPCQRIICSRRYGGVALFNENAVCHRRRVCR